MTVDRRLFLAAAGVAAPLSAAAPAVAQGSKTLQDAPLLHHVFFWLKTPGSKADRDQLIAGLKTLRGIPVIKQLHIGTPAGTEKRDVVDHSYDVSELMLFDTLADQKSYQDHPIHQAFVKSCGDLWAKVVVYDTAAV